MNQIGGRDENRKQFGPLERITLLRSAMDVFRPANTDSRDREASHEKVNGSKGVDRQDEKLGLMKLQGATTERVIPIRPPPKKALTRQQAHQ